MRHTECTRKEGEEGGRNQRTEEGTSRSGGVRADDVNGLHHLLCGYLALTVQLLLTRRCVCGMEWLSHARERKSSEGNNGMNNGMNARTRIH